MSHQLIHTGDGWTCLRCKVAWDQGEEIGECTSDQGELPFLVALVKQQSEGLPVDVVDPSTLSDYEKSLLPFRPPTPMAPPAMQTQVAGTHYRNLAIQPTEFCQRNGLDFCSGNILKYVTRHRAKNGVEDLRKARHYVEIRETYCDDILSPRRAALRMSDYVDRNSVPPAEAEALYRLEAYYNAVFPNHQRAGARRLLEEIDNLIARYESGLT